MLIREYAPSDLSAIHVLNEQAVPAVATETIDDLAHVANESTIALVADVDGVVVGFCLVLVPGRDYDSMNYLWFSERYTDFIYLDRVAIAPDFQRQGIGKAIYAEVEHLAAKRRAGAEMFTLEVNLRPRNDESLGFHSRLGFVEVGQQETDHGTLVSLMAKQL